MITLSLSLSLSLLSPTATLSHGHTGRRKKIFSALCIRYVCAVCVWVYLQRLYAELNGVLLETNRGAGTREARYSIVDVGLSARCPINRRFKCLSYYSRCYVVIRSARERIRDSARANTLSIYCMAIMYYRGTGFNALWPDRRV